MKIYDTYRGEKVEFESLFPGKALIYNCGPTVYDYAHIGNFRAYLFADLLRRWLEVSGYDVKQVMNITDVDDKTIRKALQQTVSLSEVTRQYEQAFFQDLDTLGIQRAHTYPRATEHIEEMVQLVGRLLEKGHAYRTDDGSIYFRVTSFPEYGKLSGKRLEDLRVGERVTSDEYDSKDDVRDFALWKAWDEQDGDVHWETALGRGRPGWHIECSAMSVKHLGESFDIHTGGVDNIFPHHENEIAQSRCGLDADFARYWMHCDYLIVEGKKMSKSLGNFHTLRSLLDKGYVAREIRYVLLATHYRSRLNFTLDGLKAARAALKRLDQFSELLQAPAAHEGQVSREVMAAVEECSQRFDAAMEDDLNISPALAAVFDLVKRMNAHQDRAGINAAELEKLQSLWDRWQHALGILQPLEDELEEELDTERVEELIAQREEARRSKDWSRADAIRDELVEMGVELKDSPQGTTWKRRR